MTDPRNLDEDRAYKLNKPLSSAQALQAADLIRRLTDADALRMSIGRGRRREHMKYDAERLADAIKAGWQGLHLDLDTNDHKRPIGIRINLRDDGTEIRVSVNGVNETQLDDTFAAIEAAFLLQPRSNKRDASRKFERHAGVSFTPEMTRATLDILCHFSGDSRTEVYLLTRGKQHWHEEVVRFDSLVNWLQDTEKFQAISEIRGDSRNHDHAFNWQISLPLGVINVTSWDDGVAKNHQRLEAELGELLQFQDVHISKRRYRTGTLTFEINRWSEERFRTALEMVFRNLALSSATPEQIKSTEPVPNPAIGTAYITREGKSNEHFGGPVEVLEPSYSLEEFLSRVERKLQSLRAISLGLEGPLGNTLNINANLEDNRISFWGTMDLHQIQTLIGPLIDGLKLKLVEGQPGVSLTDQPGFLENASKQISLLAKILTPAGALLTFLGISLGSGLSWALFGVTSVIATHPVANEAVFEGTTTEALVIDWKLERPVLRIIGESVLGIDPLPDALKVIVFQNGERIDLLSKRAQPPMTLPLEPGKYRIDLDHPNEKIQDASVYVNIASPAAVEN